MQVGDKVGNRTIIEKRSNNRYLMKCDLCGHEATASLSNLNSGKALRCMCERARYRGRELQEQVPVGTTINGRNVIGYVLAEDSSQRRNLITVECPLCGATTSQGHKQLTRTTCLCQKTTKTKATCLERYGTGNPAQANIVRAKIKQTCLDRYGAESPLACPEVRAKCRETWQTTLGTDNPFASQEVQDKKTDTNLERYGKTSPLAVPELRAKGKQTSLTRYGVDHPSKAQSVKDKIKDRCLSLYGTQCSAQAEEVKAKIKQTCLERYGVDHVSKNPDIITKGLQTRHANNKANGFTSKPEREIMEYVASLGLAPTHHASGGREIDVFIESCKVGIELNGVYWHSEEKGRDKRYHLKKLEMYKTQGITLIQLWDYLWIRRTKQVKNYLRARLGRCEHKVGVRKCILMEIPSETARLFVEDNHIQGARGLSIELAVGAYHQGNLIAVATFVRHHRGTGEMTLNRLCSADNWVCSGFLGKAAKYVSRKLNEPIITWVDRMWSEGASYVSAGFVPEDILQPDYFYYDIKTASVIKKQAFRKIDERTETQRAIDEGLTRVFDCGKIRFRMEKEG